MTKRIILLGGGGAGVSGIGMLARACGIDVICVDRVLSPFAQMVVDAGGVFVSQDEADILQMVGNDSYDSHDSDDDIVVYSSALRGSAILASCEQAGLRCWWHGDVTRLLSQQMTTIAIAGTHGKSTTTALSIAMLSACHEQMALGMLGAQMSDPYTTKTGMTGGRTQTNCVINPAHRETLCDVVATLWHDEIDRFDTTILPLLFVVEADEYAKRFLSIDADYALITSVNHDHTDIYPTQDDYYDVFRSFVSGVTHETWYHERDASVVRSVAAYPRRVSMQTFAFDHLIGHHNHANASLVSALGQSLCDVSESAIDAPIIAFGGIARRMEYLGDLPCGAGGGHVHLYSDYGHHPQEIQTVLAGARDAFPGREICALIEIHESRRLLEHRETFGRVVMMPDRCALYSIYKARESLDALRGSLDDLDATPQDVLHRAASHDDVGRAFAASHDLPYIVDRQGVYDYLASCVAESVCIVFSAGVLDSIVRTVVSDDLDNDDSNT